MSFPNLPRVFAAIKSQYSIEVLQSVRLLIYLQVS